MHGGKGSKCLEKYYGGFKFISCPWYLSISHENIRKPEVFRNFQSVEKDTSGVKCVKELESIMTNIWTQAFFQWK